MKSIVLAVLLLSVSQFSFGQLNPFTVGTLHPGDSIVIYYDVTINSSCGCASISNQGTVTGSNFVTLNTDDPDTGPVGDATITLLNLFPLPVRLLELKAQPRSNAIDLSWTVSHEENLSRYEIEKSNRGRDFTSIGTVAARNSLAGFTYGFTDLSPFAGNNFYRLKMIDADGHYSYSSVIRVNLNAGDADVKVFPNPVKQNLVNLQFSNLVRGAYEVSLYNSGGQIVFRKTIQHDGGSVSKVLTLPGNTSAGLYTIKIQSVNEVFTQILMINR